MGGLLVSMFVVMAMAIQNPGTCPAVADVERHLAPLLPPGFQASASDVAVIKENGDGSLTLSLARFDRGTMLQRRLPGAPTCADQAETVAVTLAVWEAQAHPEISMRLDRLPPAPTSKDADLVSSPAIADGAPTSRRNLLTLGVGLAGAWQAGSFTPAGRVDATISRVGSRLRTRFSVVGVGEHTTSVPPGSASWRRLYLGFVGEYSRTFGAMSRWAWGIGGGAAPGLVRVAGSGYAINHSVWRADLGVEVQARVEWRGARIRPWLGLTLVQWARRQTLEVIGAAATPTLPRVEPMAFLGADLPWGQ